MKILLDTHAFLWALIEPDKLSSTALRLLEDDSTDVMVSAASAWEIATRFRLGKLPGAKRVVAGYDEAMHGLQASQLAMTSDHALKAASWTVEHRDPFDRMLAAQSALEKLALISCDPAMKQFDIEVIW
jgi:PIN domain nuclease of toxin-antitoxin system